MHQDLGMMCLLKKGHELGDREATADLQGLEPAVQPAATEIIGIKVLRERKGDEAI